MRCWHWTGKGGEGGDTVMHVRIHRLGELVWVVAMCVGQGSWCGWWPCMSVRGAGVGGG